MALALGVRLTKPGVYQLHAQGHPPTAYDARRARRLVARVALVIMAAAGLAIFLISIEGAFRG